MDKKMMGGSAIVVGGLIALTEFMSWPAYLNYVWAVVVAVWGVMALK